MKPGQTRVLVLLIVLFAMEAVIHPGIKEFVQGFIHLLQVSLGGK